MSYRCGQRGDLLQRRLLIDFAQNLDYSICQLWFRAGFIVALQWVSVCVKNSASTGVVTIQHFTLEGTGVNFS